LKEEKKETKNCNRNCDYSFFL